MKYIFSFISLMVCAPTFAQPVYGSTQSAITFFAGTPVEDIDATNSKSISFLNTDTGEVTISIPNYEFRFKQSLMEEHFNENYMETGKFPKSEFKGKIDDVKDIDWQRPTVQTITVSGTLIIHGVAKERTFSVTLHRKDRAIVAETKFSIPLADHNIDRPKLLWEKLAENVNVHATITYEPYKK